MSIGADDACDTGLVLGLGRRDPPPPLKSKPSSSSISSSIDPKVFEPSLTLGLSDDAYRGMSTAAQSPSPNSFNSSAINVKRENNYEMGINEEAETRVSSRTSDEEEEGGVRKKLRLTKEQSALLEDRFKEHTTLNPKQKQALAKQLNLRPRQVEVWFQNRRARTKLKQTEVDCEVLKRCCESLTDENRRLHKELEELRALKAGPVYMQPTAFTVCPSCERISGPAVVVGADGSAKARPFIVTPPKAQFLNPFARSAAC